MGFIDYLTVKCREAGHKDKKFIEAARFGAKCLCERLTNDDPTDPRSQYSPSSWCTIWRTTEERPQDNTTIVLCNAAMVQYAFYKSGMYYYDGYSNRLSTFTGRWCYKADLWGISPESASYYKVE